MYLINYELFSFPNHYTKIMVFNFFNQVKISQAHLTIYKQSLYSLQEDGSFRNGRYITFFFSSEIEICRLF